MTPNHNSDITIITHPGDAHASAVRWALQQREQKCNLWHPCAMDKQPASIIFEGRENRVELNSPEETSFRPGQTVWLRRYGAPQLPSSMHEGDKVVASRELRAHLAGIPDVFPERTRWLNTPWSQRRANHKANQLRVAQSVGLRIPRTVITNDITVARSFVRGTKSIYKAFFPAFWKGTDSGYQTGTVVVDEAMLSEDDSLRYCPGIFQTLVSKRRELRVAIFGDKIIAAEISNQDEIDFRVDYGRIVCKPTGLPTEIEDKLRAFMSQLGLAMGQVDLIQDPTGEYFFLEVNEQGQFLWLEEKNDEILLLAAFVDFLLLLGPDESQLGFPRPRFADFLASEEKAESCAELPPDYFSVPEKSPPRLR